ncbi:MAG: ABC transporter ATP-binding protein [Clostridiales bacterium]|nr:ABC transporter ATP-binding protein [Clostridiales bacterium]
MDNNVAIEIAHVGKTYNTYRKEFDRFREALSLKRKSYHTPFEALKDVSLTVNKGECVGIIGTNGSGKSTLLKIITGVLQPTSGSVELNGRVSALLELGAGFNGNYTGIENIILNGRIMGYTEEEIKARIPMIQEFAEIGDFIYQPVKTYSSGMFARLAFAVAINVDPDILIVDEALSVGDIFFQTKCYHKFEEFRQAGKTILFVSHDLGSIIKYCDRCLLLNRGAQISVGPCREVVDIYRRILVDQYEEQNNLEKKTEEELLPSFDPSAVRPDSCLMKTSVLQNPHFEEYGTKKAEILDFGLVNSQQEVTSILNQGDSFSVVMKIRFNETIQSPIFAFTIKDHKGTELCGTNTLLEGKSPVAVEAGTCGTVRFTQRMMLQGGQYFLSLGLTGYEGDMLVVYHRLYDICHIQVLSDYNTVGVFNMESRISFDGIGAEGGKKA